MTGVHQSTGSGYISPEGKVNGSLEYRTVRCLRFHVVAVKK